MTIEKAVTFSPADVAAVSVTCQTCGTEVAFHSLQAANQTVTCPGCLPTPGSGLWTADDNENSRKNLVLALLRAMSDSSTGSVKIHVPLPDD